MKGNFDLLSIQKRAFDALVAKPMKYADQLKKEVVEMIEGVVKKFEKSAE